MIFLARHGETDWNKKGLIQGRVDRGLSETGKEQAKRISDFLQDKGISAIYCSALRRSIQTAEELSKRIGIKPTSISEINELSFGIFEGKPKSEFRASKIFDERAKDKFNYVIPEGESYAQANARIKKSLKKINLKANIAIFGHESINKLIIGNVLNLEIWQMLDVKHPNGVVYILNSLKKESEYYDTATKTFHKGLLTG
ncbi:MAG TPA: histidine phosphatase family protein [Candidatus Nanoarchaeia archaeon]|nr:histidine phosphatase family protein [Candidatus Nanoarchaeia archaeon]